MTTQDKIKVIAEYDGWELRGEPEFAPPYKIWIKHLPQGTKMIPYISPSGKEYDDWAKEMKYLTSLDWLHVTAMKVMNGLCVIALSKRGNIETKSKRLFHKIKEQCSTIPINGEYTDLFNAVYDGIVFLNSNK